MLDAHQLNVFLIAADTLNFTQAANALHMTQPSVSQHIQSLEKHFKTKLFLRKGRQLELTDAGGALVPVARELVRLSIHIDEMMESLQGEVYGHLMVGCSTTPGKYVLPRLLAQFHRKYPKVKVTCQVTSQVDAIKRLCEGEVHFALTSTKQDQSKEAEFRNFISDPVILIAPLDHPWAERGRINPQDLYKADFILREDESGTYSTVSDCLASKGIAINELNTFLVLGNSEAIALAVAEGIGVGFVSSMVVSRLSRGQVAPIKIKDLEICRDIYIGRQTRRPATTAQTAFWNFIQSAGEGIQEELTDELIELLGE
jgi:DNA-binding transcriptional LysR family regulator